MMCALTEKLTRILVFTCFLVVVLSYLHLHLHLLFYFILCSLSLLGDLCGDFVARYAGIFVGKGS